MRDGARRSLLTLGAGIALLAATAASSAPAALASPALIRGSAGSDGATLGVPGPTGPDHHAVATADVSGSVRANGIAPLRLHGNLRRLPVGGAGDDQPLHRLRVPS